MTNHDSYSDTKLRANGVRFEFINQFPFMLSLSKHEIAFFSTLLV